MPTNILANNQVREFVNDRRPFKNNNGTMFTTYRHDLYVVYSYGEHYPMYVYDCIAKQWFGNDSKSSRTTQRHKTQARPDDRDVYGVTTDYLRALILAGSYANYAAQTVLRERDAA